MLFGFHLVENVKELFRNPQQLFCVGLDCQCFGELNDSLQLWTCHFFLEDDPRKC